MLCIKHSFRPQKDNIAKSNTVGVQKHKQNTHWAGWDSVAGVALGAADGFSPGPYTLYRQKGKTSSNPSLPTSVTILPILLT